MVSLSLMANCHKYSRHCNGNTIVRSSSGSAISGMFHPHETGCNGHVSVHGNCNMECLTSHAYTFVGKCREQAHVSLLLSHTFQRDKRVRSKRKSRLLCLCLRREEIKEQWDYYLFLKPNVTRSWVWLNYHGTQQQLHARRVD